MIGERFRVESPTEGDFAGELYRATDSQARRPVLLRLFPSSLLGDEELRKVLRERVKQAAQISHPNLAAVYGMGKYKETLYLAGELVEGLSLAEHVARRRQSAKFFPLVGLQKAFSPLVSALAQAHAQGVVHGAVSARWVQVTEQGRVALRGLGFLSPLLAQPELRQALLAEGCLLAPEVQQNAALSPQADVYALGALLYELLTNQPVPSPYVPPTAVRGDIPPDFDNLLVRCLSPDPAHRFPNAEALGQALNQLFARAAQPKPAAAAPVAPAAPGPALPKLPQARSQDEEERWLVAKQGLDYGPYTAKQLRKQLEDGEINEETQVLDCESSLRKPIGDHDYFRAFVDDWRKNVAKRDALRESAAVEKSVKAAGKNRLATIGGVAGGLVALVLGYFFILPSVRDQDEDYPLLATQGVPKLDDELPWLTKKSRVPKPKHRKRGPGGAAGVAGASGGSGGAPGIASGYDDSDSMTIDFGDDSSDGGTPVFGGGPRSKLSGSDIERAMSGISGGLAGCAKDEKRRGGVGSFSFSFIATTEGKARGIRITAPDEHSPALESCVKGAVSRASFPKMTSETPGAYSFGIR